MDDVYVRAPARTRFPSVNVALFVATSVTTLMSGWYLAGAPIAAGASSLARLAGIARAGLPFAGSLLAILFAHEMGHYVVARRYRVDATLPFFIPFLPWGFGGIGTLGAVIRIRSRFPTRRSVLDIGAAGPIAGFVVAVPLLLWGYAHSPVTSGVDLGLQSPLGWLIDWIRGAPSIPEAGRPEITVFGRSLASWAALHLTHPGLPAGADVAEHPVAIAAWIGLLVTALNMLPVGQLDGGHVLYALLGGERARRASQAFSWALLLLGLTVSLSWLVWFVITRVVVGVRHPPALDEAPLSPGRRAFAIASLLLFVVTFAPMPFRAGFLP
jgi:membrane-associated protease RseP (regulator of RpoE activity)